MNPPSASQDNGGLGSTIKAGPITFSPPSGQVKSILVLVDATFGAGTVGNMDGLSGAQVSAGNALFGIWDSIQISSGTIVAYYG